MTDNVPKSKSMPDTEVQKLIFIANGGLLEKKRSWFTLWMAKEYYQYSLSEQLEAIEKLGKSRNPLALGYLKKLKVEDGESLKDEMDITYGSKTHYPDTRGDLAYSLSKNDENSPYGKEQDKEALRILETAISDLELSLQQ